MVLVLKHLRNKINIRCLKLTTTLAYAEKKLKTKRGICFYT